MEYEAVFEQDGDDWVVTLPAVPEVVAGGTSKEAALANAAELLEIALLTYLKDGRSPPPSDVEGLGGRSGARVMLPATAVAKIAFIEAFQASGLTRVALAGRLGKAETEVRRMLDFYHPTKLPALEDGLKALGKRLVVSVREAA